MGTAAVADCADLTAGEMITMGHLRRQKHAEEAEFLLFCTGWDRYWGTAAYFGSYLCLDGETADWLLRQGKKGGGLDALGLDPVTDIRRCRCTGACRTAGYWRSRT